ncbi:MAG: hypothetical protein IH998_07660 [Proteobacteria bacterium]|nr:hypothetical protein [Pseudomonadota bacterium]
MPIDASYATTRANWSPTDPPSPINARAKFPELRTYVVSLKLTSTRLTVTVLAALSTTVVSLLRIIQICSVSDDPPAKTYVERCRLMAKEPPPQDWDGVWRMTTK